MIYAAFSFYLLGILFAGRGIYRLWADLFGPAAVNWALLPGTVVAEMAYIFGCLITGGEIRRAKLMDGEKSGGKGSDGGGASEPTTEAKAKLRFIGPLVAAFMSILACGAGILIVHSLLGEPVVGRLQYIVDRLVGGSSLLPREIPTSADAFWLQAHTHVDLMRSMGRTWVHVKWLDWRVPLFVYLALCLSIRLAPIRRSLRATLAAIAATAAIIALLGLWNRFDKLMLDLWPLVTYVWASLVLLLAVSLVVRGTVSLIRGLIKDTPAK